MSPEHPRNICQPSRMLQACWAGRGADSPRLPPATSSPPPNMCQSPFRRQNRGEEETMKARQPSAGTGERPGRRSLFPTRHPVNRDGRASGEKGPASLQTHTWQQAGPRPTVDPPASGRINSIPKRVARQSHPTQAPCTKAGDRLKETAGPPVPLKISSSRKPPPPWACRNEGESTVTRGWPEPWGQEKPG